MPRGSMYVTCRYMQDYGTEGPYKADKEYNSSNSVVPRLTSHISGSTRNVIFDNWYTTYSLVKSLLCDHTFTAMGTIEKNKREIPKDFLKIKKRPTCDRMFGFREKLTLVSYIPRSKSKKKNVVLISSMPHDKKIDKATGEDAKPEIITFYNSTKGEVDVVNMMMKPCAIAGHSEEKTPKHAPAKESQSRFFKMLPETAVATTSTSSNPSQTKAKRILSKVKGPKGEVSM